MISIIIPTYNEQNELPKLLQHLKNCAENFAEVIVVDAGSTDGTNKLAADYGVLLLRCPQKGRAIQMNYGAARATGEILYFVHADTFPVKTFINDIYLAVRNGFDLGRYCSTYQSKSLLLKLNALLSNFDTVAGMGGDQTLFITKKHFDACGGFNSEMKIMEEFEFCKRARKEGKYKIIRKAVSISARKYEKNSWLTVQKANFKVFKMYAAGAKQDDLVSTYRNMLKR
ncbi:rSAM/selenodomain-associated transferase 2 [Pedobacter sp. UYP30]|uniref:TIGR04283 family arsenosugar biosynthesis glycosyltransferase n=1 Tax=Pedobacter sp. UYP30 TaxID=1756400 RepID=UPI00339AB0D5